MLQALRVPVRGPVCRCGARRRDAQLGSEPSPDCLAWTRRPLVPCGGCFVCNLVAVFRQVRRVLRDDGTVWLNLGDSYVGGKTGREDLAGHKGSFGGRNVVPVEDGDKFAGTEFRQRKANGMPSGNLVGVPWRVALALQADGWVLRQDVIWHKPAPMLESVKNRCTKAHEYVFLLVKGPGYYYDAEAVKERAGQPHDVGHRKENVDGHTNYGGCAVTANGSSNKRSVWTIAQHGYHGAHFATFPPKLVEPCLLAGTSAKGACAKCGAPWRRVTEERALERALARERPNDYVKRVPPRSDKQSQTAREAGIRSNNAGFNERYAAKAIGNTCANTVAGVAVRTVGWEPTCECFGRFETATGPAPGAPAIAVPGWAGSAKGELNVKHVLADLSETVEKATRVYVPSIPLDQHPVVPCVVLDPFCGSGTTVCVALEHGRAGWGIDLSEQYLRANAVPRISDHLTRAGLLRLLDPYAAARAREREAARGRDGLTV